MIAPPEPELTAADLLERAVALRPVLRERQAETERLTHCPAQTHEDFLRAGFYRMLQPRRFGGYEFSVPAFYRVMTEVVRGCPSSGWALMLAAGNVLQVAAVFDADAQAEIFGPEGDFRAACTPVPVGVAEPDGDGHLLLDGTWSYCSGSPYATHYVGQTVRAPKEPGGTPGPPVVFVAPRAVWSVVDDWHGVLGLRGSGSNSIRMERARIPVRHTLEGRLADPPVEGGSVGARLHGNPMYAGRTGSFFQGMLAAALVGMGYAATDEYARVVAARPLLTDPARTRADSHDHQRHLGEALAALHTAQAAVQQNATDWTEACRRNVSGEAPFTVAEDDRLALVYVTAGRIAYEALQALVRTVGSRHLRDGERMQRYVRDATTCWTHAAPGMAEPLARRVACARLGLPFEDVPLMA